MKRCAMISGGGRYRYKLLREWDETLHKVLFVMLNPSTADMHEDDATIRRCIGFAKDLGYGGLLVGNLFAWCSAYPRKLHKARAEGYNIVGVDNDEYLHQMAEGCALVICAWGHNADRYPVVVEAFKEQFEPHRELYALQFTKSGQPSHPVRLPKLATDSRRRYADTYLRVWREGA